MRKRVSLGLNSGNDFDGLEDLASVEYLRCGDVRGKLRGTEEMNSIQAIRSAAQPTRRRVSRSMERPMVQTGLPEARYGSA